MASDIACLNATLVWKALLNIHQRVTRSNNKNNPWLFKSQGFITGDPGQI